MKDICRIGESIARIRNIVIACVRNIAAFFLSPLVFAILFPHRVGMQIGERGTVKFFPYTFMVCTVNASVHSFGISWTKTLDPVNLMFVGFSSSELKKLFREKGWRFSMTGSGQYLLIHSRIKFMSFQCDWEVSKERGERFHVRCFDAGKSGGVPVILASAHHEYKDFDVNSHLVTSWDRAKNFVSSFFTEFPQEKSDRISKQNWRDKPSDGRATIIYRE